jgi:hypothetical protein
MYSALIIGLIFVVIFSILGIVFLIIGLRSKQKAKASLNWPTTTGVVTVAKVEVHTDYDDDDHTSTTSYEPVVQYTYTVNGQQFNGSKIAFGANRVGNSQAQKMVGQYPVGNSVTVHYNPEKPEDAVLETKATGGTAFTVIGIVFLAIGLIACCVLGGIGAYSYLTTTPTL